MNRSVLLLGGKSTWVLIDKVVVLVVNVGLNLVLIPRFGILGAAMAWAVSIVVDNVIDHEREDVTFEVEVFTYDANPATAIPVYRTAAPMDTTGTTTAMWVTCLSARLWV
mgnify:CR=1 FL=1